MRFSRLLFLLIAIAAQNVAMATDYYWQYGTTGNYPSIQAACDGWGESIIITGSDTKKFEGITNQTSTYAYCKWGTYSSTGSRKSDNFVWLYRRGDSCPLDSTYNSVSGSCDLNNICLKAKGASTTYYVKTQLDSPPPDVVDIGGCLAQFAGPIICRNHTDGYAVCHGIATITGEQTPAAGPVAGPGIECSGPSCTAEDPQAESGSTPCEYATDPATGVQLCKSSKYYKEPGTSNCGTANGQLVCTEDPKSQSQNQDSTSQKQTTTNPDGSTSSTTTTTTITTSCTGINSCSTTTSTTSSSGGTNSDGSSKPDSTSCTGDACTKPDGLDNTKDGEGLASGDLQAPEKGNFTEALAEMDQKIEQDKEDLKSSLQRFRDLFSSNALVNLSGGDGGRLFCQSAPVLNTEFSICMDKYADHLSGLRWILIFVATLIAFFIIFRQ